MNDDWRLQIDLDDAGVSGQINDHLRASELEHDLETAFDQRVIVSHEGETIYLYAGDRDQLDRAQRVVQGQLDQKGWDEVSSLLTETLDKVFEIQSQSAKRISDSGEDGMLSKVEMLHFKAPDPA